MARPFLLCFHAVTTCRDIAGFRSRVRSMTLLSDRSHAVDGFTSHTRKIPSRRSATQRTIVLGLCLLAGPLLPVAPRSEAAPVGDAGVSDKDLTSGQAGVRYGQAAGVAVVCYWLKATKRVEELRAKYREVGAAEFDAEAAKTLAAWSVPAICRNAGPNACRLSILWSCQQAMKEIGPEGSIFPGLVEPRQQAR